MLETIQLYQLTQAVGMVTQDYRGVLLGEIVEIKINECNQPEYVILKSSTCFGRGDRFFAVTATPRLIRFAPKSKIILQLEKDDLQFAKGIAANMLPKPHLKPPSGPSIFELYNYTAPSHKKNYEFTNAKISNDKIPQETF